MEESMVGMRVVVEVSEEKWILDIGEEEEERSMDKEVSLSN